MTKSISLASTAAFLLLGLGTAASAQEACSTAPVGDTPFECLCAGGLPGGSVWGSSPYTADSSICAAALHAGAIGKDGGLVRVLPGPGLDSYAGSFVNGIETRDWGAYGTSFEFQIGAPSMEMTSAECTAFPSGEASHTCTCAPYDGTGSVWGSGPYTADSAICVAAMHAGVISDFGGEVTAMSISGLESYRGTEAFGVTTRDWGSYGESFIFNTNN